MVQRGKVLEIEGPTPKFLYAMLKQLDLKIVSSSLEDPWPPVVFAIEFLTC
jgi:hypothetical protein